jgi:hypothetical protein
MTTIVSNDRPGKFDAAHRDKLAESIWEAIMAVSTTEVDGVRVMHVRTKEVIDAFAVVIAFVEASHRDVVTPRDRRLLAEAMSKQLFRRLGTAREAGPAFKFGTYDDDPMH